MGFDRWSRSSRPEQRRNTKPRPKPARKKKGPLPFSEVRDLLPTRVGKEEAARNND